jgi:hypothetical protein
MTNCSYPAGEMPGVVLGLIQAGGCAGPSKTIHIPPEKRHTSLVIHVRLPVLPYCNHAKPSLEIIVLILSEFLRMIGL